MKNLYTSFIFIFFTVTINAQIGINTEAPLLSSVLHIDPKSNTSENNNITDDIIINSQGDLGIGTLNPTSNLTINGTFRMNDGTQKEGRILVSNADGIASWKSIFVNQYVVWELVGKQTFNDYTSTSLYNSETTSSTLIRNEISGCTISGGVLTLPSGRYLLSINGDMAEGEFCTIDLLINNSIYKSFLAVNSLGGSSIVLNLSTISKLQLNVTHIQVNTPSYPSLPYNTFYQYFTTVVQLSNI